MAGELFSRSGISTILEWRIPDHVPECWRPSSPWRWAFGRPCGNRGWNISVLAAPAHFRADRVLTKLATGSARCLWSARACRSSCTAAGQRHRNIASPFRWSWTLPTWMVIGIMLPVYVGAFPSGLRPARWFGTRLFPPVTPFLLLHHIFGIFLIFPNTHGDLALSRSWLWPCCTGVLAVCYVAQIQTIKE